MKTSNGNCPFCRGTGKIPTSNGNCPFCRGTGKIPTSNWLTKGMTEEEIAREKKEALADIVEVVRCKDCKHYDNESGAIYSECCCLDALMAQDDFCSYGERREK